MGPTGPRWPPCWPHELCYRRQGWVTQLSSLFVSVSVALKYFHFPMNTLRPIQNGRHFHKRHYKCIFFRSEFHLTLFLGVQLKQASLRSDYALVPNRWQAIRWTKHGFDLLTHKCGTRPRWVKATAIYYITWNMPTVSFWLVLWWLWYQFYRSLPFIDLLGWMAFVRHWTNCIISLVSVTLSPNEVGNRDICRVSTIKNTV